MSARRAPIFGFHKRTSAAPAKHSEPVFEFFERIAGDYWEHPRHLIQEWAGHVRDAADYNELRQRLRSGNDYEFRSAFLELYLHECLLRGGWSLTIHPSLPASGSHPDFLAVRGEDAIYVEAIAPAASRATQGSANRQAVLLDVLNEVRDTNFLLGVLDIKEGAEPPKSAALRSEVRLWLKGMDPDILPQGSSAAGPKYTWRRHDWEVTVQAIPIRPEFRGVAPARSIGYYGHHPVTWINHSPTIKKALSAKHHAYGRDLGAPFLIALGTYFFDRDRWHATNALYGQEAIEVSETSDGKSTVRNVRRPDGYFGAPPRWRNRNISGVLVVNQLAPEYVQRAETTLWRHPHPDRPLPTGVEFPGSTVELRADRFQDTPTSTSPSKFLGLAEPWPPGDPWPGEP